jgi:nitrite reductase/ring-hydroxylating ferredoxin subunit
MTNDLDRRRFLACAACGALASACGTPSVVPFPTAETGATGLGGDTSPGDAGYPCNQTIDPTGPGWQAVDCADLDQVGGSCFFDGMIIARAEEDCYSAVSAYCAHQGAQLYYDPDRQVFKCPLHGAVYDLTGGKVSGPQPTGIEAFPCGRVGDTVWVKKT